MAKKTAPAPNRTRRVPASSDGTARPNRAPANGTRGGDGTTADSLDKVRDILFGSQMRESDARFARMEDQINAHLAELREDFRKRLDSLEAYAKNEINRVMEKLKGETQARTDALRELTGEHRNDVKNLEKALKQMGDTSEKRDREVRQELLDQSTKLRDEVTAARGEMSESLGRTAAELRDTKADRAMLAEMFTQVALGIAGEVPKRGK